MKPIQQRWYASGFTMVEILVGMLIAMLGIVIMTQVSTTFEAQKRTTTGGDDASSTGAISLYQMQRDLRFAGYGFASRNVVGCDLTIGGTIFPAFAPLTIGSLASDANTESLLISYGTTNGSPEGDGITAQPGAKVYAVQTPTFFSVGDWVIATPAARANPCTGASGLVLDQVTAVDNAAKTVTVATGVAGMANGVLFNQGASFRVIGYAVRSGNLMRCDFTAALPAVGCANVGDWTPAGSDVVSMRALYGKDTVDPVDSVDRWEAAAPVAVCDWVRARAARIALVIRNAQYEKTNVAQFPPDGFVTPVAPSWSASTATTDTPTAVPIDLTANPLWQNYRYKVFETVAPIRNISYAQSAAKC